MLKQTGAKKRNRPGDGGAVGIRVEQREGQIKGAAGRTAVVLDLVLISEGRALSEHWLDGDKQATQNGSER